jgi:hypothetical protein
MRPSRVPGAEGANATTIEQEERAASDAPQSVVSVKSPVRVSARANAELPVLETVRVWVPAETPVTTTAVGKVRAVAEMERLGFAAVPLAVGWGRDSPVTRTVRPWSRLSVTESDDGVCVDW